MHVLMQGEVGVLLQILDNPGVLAGSAVLSLPCITL